MSSPTSTLHLSAISLTQLYALLHPITVPNTSPNAKFANWSRTFTCSPLAIFEPTTELHCELILELARRERKVVRAVGVGHSPSDLACTTGYMLRTTKLDRLLEVSIILDSFG
jgi:L-gulonolactone oxidase